MRIALPAAIDAAALASCDPAATIADLGGETMGTRWHVRLVPPPGADLTALNAAIVARLDGIVAEMSHWLPSSLLSRFNRAPPGTWTTLPPDFAHVMARGLAIAAASDGAFDPAIGRLVDRWGFGPQPVAGPPDEAAIAAALAASGWRKLAYSAGDRRLRQPGGVRLDLSGIAKGFAVDAVAKLLTARGVAHCLVEIGGELVGQGMRPAGEPWWVDLEVPPEHNASPLRVALHGLAVATSGDYRRGGHTIDPRTGWPIGHGVVSVSVIDRSALVADAWATALGVLGAAAGMACAADRDIAARILVGGGEQSREYLSPALAAMLAD